MKPDHDLEQFKRDMEGLTERAQLLDLARRGLNAQKSCKALGIPMESYRRWFDSDVEFRVQLYAAVCGTTVEALLACVEEDTE